jgi:GT2 family glycosyltransferase
MRNGITGVIVLNWNGAADTLACLSSLAKVRDPACRVLVVDNGSTDNSVELIRSGFPEVAVLPLAGNAGYAGGNNAGFAWMERQGATRVVFLNNDTVVDAGFLAPLVDALVLDPGTGIAVPKICYMDDPGRIWYAGGEIRTATGLVRHVGIRKKDSTRYSVPGTTGYATGCCLAMRCRDFADAGGFDEGLGMYGEDADLSLRVRGSGLKIRYVPSSTVWHRVSASVGGEMSARKQVRKIGSTFRLLLKHRSWTGVVLYPLLLPFRSAAPLFRHLLSERAFHRGKHRETTGS